MTEKNKPAKPYLVVSELGIESYADMAEAREAAVNVAYGTEGKPVEIYQLRASVRMEWKPTWNEQRGGE